MYIKPQKRCEFFYYTIFQRRETMKKILLIVFLLIAAACSAYAQDTTYYNSVILGHNIPQYARKGETRSVSVIVMNTANNTWTRNDNYKLGTCNAVNGGNDGPAPFSDTRILINSGTSVAKGQIYIFTFNMTFNSSGTATTIFRMVREGVTWFGSGISVSTTVLDSAPFSWDVTGAPSTSSATNGVWTFGWYTPSAGSTSFTAYNLYQTDGPDKAWRNSENWDYHGYVGYRDTNSIRTDYSQLRLPYTMYMGSAGLAGGQAAKGWSTVRFTAPCSGTFYFTTRFSPSGTRTGNVNGSNTSGATVYIKKNHSSSNLYTDTRNGSIYGGGTFQTINTSSNTYERAFSQSLNKGDTIDLIENSYQANNSCSVLDLFRVYCSSPKITVSGRITTTAGGGGISGATVSYGGQSATTDSNGYYTINNVAYSTSGSNMTVSASNHASRTVSVTPNAITVTSNVQLQATCQVTVKVQSNYSGNPVIPYASVTVNGSSKTTGDAGTAGTWTVNRGTQYTASVTNAPAHSTGSVNFTPGNNETSKTVTITLSKQTALYVNFNQGNDNNNGTSTTTPWKTFSRVNRFAKPGDTVNICGNSTAAVSADLELNGLNGTSSNRIVVRPYYSTYNATYQGCTIAPTSGFCITIRNCSYITLDGARSDGNVGYIELKTAPKGGVSLNGSSNCIIKNLNIHDLGPSDASECTGIRTDNACNNNYIVRNYINKIGSGTKNTTYNSACTGGSTTSGAATYFAYNTVINVGNVTRVWQSDHVYASNNICVDIRGCNPDAVFTGTASNLTTRNNMIKSYTATNQYQDSGSGNGTDKWGVDPKFGSNYRLSSTSPAINIGTDGSTLLTNCGCSFTGTPDLGCYEFTGTPQCLVSVKVQSNYSGNPVIEGATATVNGTAKTTGSNGIAGTFTVDRGTQYSAAITNAPAHSDGSTNFTPSTTEAAKTVTITLTKGNTFYVNFDSGDDGKTGLTGYPWKTFTHVSTWAKAGDTVNVTGTSTNAYSGTAFPTMTGCNGTSSSPIIVKPYNTGAVFSATVSAGTRGIQLENCSYVIIDGTMNNTFGRFEFTVAERGVNLNNCNHCVVKNCNIHDINSDGTTEGAGIREFNGSHHNTYIRNLINKVGIANSKLNGAFTSGGNPEPQSTVFAYNTVNDATNGVRVWNGYGEGTAAKSHVVVKNNIFSNIRGGCGENQSAVFHADWRNDELDGNITAENNIITSGYYKQYDYMDGTSQTNLWDVDPLFTSASNFVPLGYSPAVDAGNDTAIFATAGITSGVGYPAGYAPDMGCYEVSTPQYRLTGAVTSDYDNTPISGATVTVNGTDYTTDANGVYTIIVNRPTNAGSASYGLGVAADSHDGDSATVTADTAGPTVVTNFSLNALSVISGVITSAFDNRTLGGVTVTIGSYPAVTTAADGSYTITVDRDSSPYTYTAEKTMFTTGTSTVTANAVAVSKSMALTEWCDVTGTVTCSYDNNPVSGVAVNVDGTAATTGSDGRYTARVLRDNDYALAVTDAGYLPFSDTGADNGTPTTANIVLDKIVGSLAEMAGANNGATVATGFDLVVTNSKGIFPGSVVYAQSEDRLRGVKMVLGDDTMLLGDRVRVVGTVAADGAGKKLIVTDVPTDVSGDAPDTLGLAKSNLTNYVLVRVWGTVKSVSGSTFTVFNGNKTFTCIAPDGTVVTRGDIVSVTGIATPDGVLMRTAADYYKLK